MRERHLRLARPALVKRVRLALERGPLLVTAPAGYGKTALLDAVLEEGAASRAKVTCTTADRDAHRLVVRLLSAVASAVPGAADELRERSLAATIPVDPSTVVGALLDDLGRVLVDPVGSS